MSTDNQADLVGLRSKLPWRPELPSDDYRITSLRKHAEVYATDLISNGDIIGRHEELVFGLMRAAEYFYFGASIDSKLANDQQPFRGMLGKLKSLLLRRRRGNPEKLLRYPDKGFIHIMAMVWEHFGHDATPPYYKDSGVSVGGEDIPSKFSSFCEKWLSQVAPHYRVPGRSTYRRVLKAFHSAQNS